MKSLTFDVTIVEKEVHLTSVTTENGFAFSLPSHHFPAYCKAGDKFPLDLALISEKHPDEQEHAKMTKALLNEILTKTPA